MIIFRLIPLQTLCIILLYFKKKIGIFLNKSLTFLISYGIMSLKADDNLLNIFLLKDGFNMKTKTKKILMSALISAMLISSVGATSVSAASSTSGTLNGVSCSGSVYYVQNAGGVTDGVAATTSFGGGGTIKATAWVYYKVNGTSKDPKSSTTTSSGGGTLAIVRTNDLGTVYGGKGTHYVKFGDYIWSPVDTTIGVTW